MIPTASMAAKVALAAPVAFFVLLLVLERRFPLRRRKRAFGRRFLTNVIVTAASFGVAAITVKPVVLWIAVGNLERPFGLIHFGGMPWAVRFAVGFVLMDLTFYWWHRAAHEVGLLWRFHNVHHFDPDLDVSTSFRFHFAEIAISTGFRFLQAFLLGVTPVIVVVYEVVFLTGTLFHHSNIRLPLGLERALNLVFVTPRMHGIHHSQVPGETNSNYSSVFRCWDRLHRTLVLDVAQDRISIGVPGYMRRHNNRLWSILSAPFLRQKEYWVWPNGKTPTRQRPEGPGRRNVLPA